MPGTVVFIQQRKAQMDASFLLTIEENTAFILFLSRIMYGVPGRVSHSEYQYPFQYRKVLVPYGTRRNFVVAPLYGM